MIKPKVERELLGLFGDLVVMLAKATDPASLTLTADLMDRVHGSADYLLQAAGQPEEQKKFIASLAFDHRLILCMWLIDTELATKIIKAVYAKG
jgi:hypothetical protein